MDLLHEVAAKDLSTGPKRLSGITYDAEQACESEVSKGKANGMSNQCYAALCLTTSPLKRSRLVLIRSIC